MIPYEFKRKLTVNKEISVEKSPSARDIGGQRSVSSSASVHRSRSTFDARSVTTKRSIASPLPEWFEPRTLGVREWIIVIVEISATYATHIVRRRKSTAEEALKYGKTERDLEISFLFVQGWAALGSMVAGIICDCYIGPYALALCSIWVNFITASIYLTEEIIKYRIKFNPYSEAVSNISSLAFIVIKSTDFSRIVFALENSRRRKESAVVFLLFVLILIGDKPRTGGLLWLITNYLNLSLYTQVMVSFYTTGISLILFHLVPRSTSEREFSYIARKVVQSLVLTTSRSLRVYREVVNPLGYKAYDRQTAATTRDLLILFSSILPTIGYLFFLTGLWADGNLWEAFVNQSDPPGLYQYTGATNGLQIMVYLSMFITFFILRPLSLLVGIKQKFSHHFVLGYLVSLFVCWYSTGSAKVYEPAGSLQDVGHVRILNTREDEVQIITDDINISKRNFTVTPHEGIMLSIPVHRESLLRTIFAFNEMDNLITYVEVTPKKCVAYVLVNPPELVRVKGYIPIWMGVPEAHNSLMARFYVFTAARSFVDMKFTLEQQDSDIVIKDGPLEPGVSFIFEVPPGKYSVRLQKFNVEEKLEVAQGSVSGLIFYSDYHSGKVIVDEVVRGMVASPLFITGFGIGFGFSLIFGYISLVYMAFVRAPQGFLTTTFGYLAFQENLTYWILFFGFHTWHDQVTSHVLMLYSFSISFLFFLCIFVYMKYTTL